MKREAPPIPESWQGKSLAGLPPEARAPFVKLADKKRKTGKDVGRLLMFNSMAALNNDPLFEFEESRNMVAALPERQRLDYKDYSTAFCILGKSVDLVESWEKQLSLTYNLLALHFENAITEITRPANNGLRLYDMAAIKDHDKWEGANPSLQRHNDWTATWNMAKQAITKAAVERFKFIAAGRFLKIPGLEVMLDKHLQTIDEVIQLYNKHSQEMRTLLKQLVSNDSFEWVIYEWTSPLPAIAEFEAPPKVMREATARLNLLNFPLSYEIITDKFTSLFE